MEDVVLQSSLGMDEVEENFKDVDLYDELMTSLQEVLDKRGVNGYNKSVEAQYGCHTLILHCKS